MRDRRIKILVYGLYLLISTCLFILLFMVRNQFNWLSGGLRELFTYLLIGQTIIFLLITIISYLKSKRKEKLSLGLIGIIPCIIAIPYYSVPVFYESNNLNEKVETIELTYITWACDCANWATKEDLEKYSDNAGDSLAHQCIFIEPVNQTLELPDTLGYSNDVIRFTGQFYNKRGVPKGYQSFESPDEARVFRYTDYEIMKSNYREYVDLENRNE